MLLAALLNSFCSSKVSNSFCALATHLFCGFKLNISGKQPHPLNLANVCSCSWVGVVLSVCRVIIACLLFSHLCWGVAFNSDSIVELIVNIYHCQKIVLVMGA